jgi:hypothetical protein
MNLLTIEASRTGHAIEVARIPAGGRVLGIYLYDGAPWLAIHKLDAHDQIVIGTYVRLRRGAVRALAKALTTLAETLDATEAA